MVNLWRHPGHLFWVLIAYLPCLGLMSIPLTGDQKLYLSTALEMKDHGSLLKPFLFGETSYNKPPFQYWMTLLGWKLVGVNLWGALLPSLFCLVLTSWFLGEIVYLLHGRKEFINAGLWFAASLGAFTFGTTAQMEIYLCLFYTASWWLGLRFLASPHSNRQPFYLYLAFGVAGIAALVKSPLYSIFWVMGFLSYLILSGEWELVRSKRLGGALLLGIMLGVSWYAVILIVDGQRFWAQYVIQENFGKSGGNDGTLLSLWSALLYFCFPFTLLILPALRAFWKGRHVGEGLRFLIAWTWPPLFFFSLHPYRIKPYAFILVPCLAILVDWGYFRAGRTRFYRTTTLVSSLLVFLSFTILGGVLLSFGALPLWIPIGLITAGVWSLFCGFRDWMRGLVLCGIAGVLFLRLIGISLGEQDLVTLRSLHASHPLAPIALLDENKNVWHESGLLTAALSTRVHRLTDLNQVTLFLQKGGMVALDDEQSEAYLKNIEAKLLGQGDLRPLGTTPWLRWKKRMKLPIKELIQAGHEALTHFESLTKRQFKILILQTKI